MVIQWTRAQRRSTELARRLGVDVVFIYPGRARWAGVLGRYLYCARETWRVLERRRPKAVVVVVPPNFLALVVELFRWWRTPELRILYDAHTGAIIDRKWRWTLWIIRRALTRPATGLITTLAELVPEVGGEVRNAFCLPDPFPHVAVAAERDKEVSPPVAFVINSYSPDEPLPEIIRAASLLPWVRFSVSGRLPRRVTVSPTDIPGNMKLTGFLPEEDYWRALARSTVAVVLTERRLTMLSGAYEAVTVGVPMVLSDQPGLRAYFGGGAVFTINKAAAIAAAIHEAINRRDELAQGVRRVRTERENEWLDLFRPVREFFQHSDHGLA